MKEPIKCRKCGRGRLVKDYKSDEVVVLKCSNKNCGHKETKNWGLEKWKHY